MSKLGPGPQGVYSDNGEQLLALVGPDGEQYPVGEQNSLKYATLSALMADKTAGTLTADHYAILNTTANLAIDVELSGAAYIITGSGNYVSYAGLSSDAASGDLPVGTYQAGGQIYYWSGAALTQITSNSTTNNGAVIAVVLQSGDTSAVAIANSTAIQTALNNGGLVQILNPGVYYVAVTHIIPNHTTVQIGDDVELRQYGSTPFNYFTNSYWNSSPQAVSSITAAIETNSQAAFNSSRIQVVVTYTSTPDVVVGDGIMIKGDTSGNNGLYNGIWEVTGVSGSSVTFFMAKGGGSGAPSNGTGTITATRSNINCHITGLGVLNGEYNALNKVPADNYNDYAIMWNNCKHPVLDGGLKIWDTGKGGLTAANCMDAKSGNLDFVLNSSADCIHYYGPQFGYPEIYDLTGTSGDDGAVFQTIDTTGYTQFMPPNAGGSFYNGGRIEGIKLHHGGNSASAVLYPTGGLASDTGFRMYGTYIIRDTGPLMKNNYTGMTMSTHAAVAVGNSYVPHNGAIENLLLENIEGAIEFQNPGGGTINIDTLTINGHCNANIVGDSAGVGFGANMILPKVTIVDGSRTTQNGDSNDWYVTFGDASLVIGELNFVRPRLNTIGSSANTLFQFTAGGATIGAINIDKPSLSSNSFLLNSNSYSASGTLVVNIRDAYNLPSGNYPITVSSGAYEINLYGGSCSATPFNCYGGTTKIKAFNFDAPANTSLFVNHTGVSVEKWISGNGYQSATPVTGGSVNISTLTGDDSVVVVPAGTLANLDLNFPANASSIDGETREVRITQNITTLAGSGGTIIGLPSSVSAGWSRKFLFSTTAGGWC